ncbi:PAP2 superfamily protein [Mycolicibacterium chubuense NBB4]|uniref:PAP2 superfamily protein n=1 Tax=Mycolicibacterium chubuense (strain NBB4) TaxID=710421 RepID=I4BQE0_MYCCN|nr:phosphatase PAP2 family protein [Mycolicibacterium chubuense]AFM19497.1 PAP2 superfamily protein [Mycolicibacterium chubuense NBB4]
MTRSQTRVALDGDHRLRRARHQWTAVLIAAVLFGIAVYLLAVQTTTGQRLEDAALRGADQVDPELHRAALHAFHTITLTSQLVATVIVGVIGLLRRQVWLAVAGVGIILGGQAITQLLKFHVLSRPDLVAVGGKYAENTLPSGHTTAAMCLLFATLIVMPYRFRGVAMFVTLTWAVGIGAYTVIIQAHRLSDTLAGNAVALVVACTAAQLLAWTGRIRAVVSPSPGRYTLRTVFVVVVGVMGAASLALGAVQMLHAAAAYVNDEPTAWRLFLSSQWLAAAGSIGAALLFWWTWYRLETKRRHDPVAMR